MEKFGLLNLLKAIQTLSPPAGTEETADGARAAATERNNPTSSAAPINAEIQVPNVMASVLERHETVSNRIKNRR